MLAAQLETRKTSALGTGIPLSTAIIFLAIVMNVFNQRNRNIEDSLSHLNC
jgi:hypothetical protein